MNDFVIEMLRFYISGGLAVFLISVLSYVSLSKLGFHEIGLSLILFLLWPWFLIKSIYESIEEEGS